MEQSSIQEDSLPVVRYCVKSIVLKNIYCLSRNPVPARPRELKVEDALLYLDQVRQYIFLVFMKISRFHEFTLGQDGIS